ncbi:hypothetical protein K1X76_03115 [bacterium]|nr:hypothetical protein [bacterium]
MDSPQMSAQPMYAPVPVKKSSGCFPFTCGCFLGMVFMLMIIAGGISVAGYFAGQYVNRHLASFYESQIREVIKEAPLPQSQKQKLIQQMDVLVKEFPNMSLSQKQEAFEKLFKEIGFMPADTSSAPFEN